MKQNFPYQMMKQTAMNTVPYREARGSLLYFTTRNRPDIAIAVSMLGKFQSEPGLKHWRMVQHVVSYLKGTTEFCIFIPNKSTDLSCIGYTDVTWARD